MLGRFSETQSDGGAAGDGPGPATDGGDGGQGIVKYPPVGPALLPVAVDEDFAIQGEYVGSLSGGMPLAAQVIALGQGKFRAVFEPGGLPGAGWDEKTKFDVNGEREGQDVRFDPSIMAQEVDTGGVPAAYQASIDTNGKMSGTTSEGTSFVLERVVRESPTLNQPPPPGGLWIFDGSSTDGFVQGSGYSPGAGAMTADGLITNAGATTKRAFRDFHLHVEFRIPYDPEGDTANRGNGGIYLQGRYEVQVLDSLGLAGTRKHCGGIWSLQDPLLDMSFPPLSFQTFDVDFVAARYDGTTKAQNARATIALNGVVIHDDIELPTVTETNPVPEGPEPGPIYLQNHPFDVRYRNLWIVEK